MTTARIGGNSIDITLGTQIIHVKTVSVDITDNTAATQSRGIPDGYVAGDVSAEGEMEVDTKNFKNSALPPKTPAVTARCQPPIFVLRQHWR